MGVGSLLSFTFWVLKLIGENMGFELLKSNNIGTRIYVNLSSVIIQHQYFGLLILNLKAFIFCQFGLSSQS